MEEILVSEAIAQGALKPVSLPDKAGTSPLIVVPETASREKIAWGQALRNLVSGCLVLSLGIILIYHFFLFWTRGSVIIEEPNRVILFLETMMSLAITAFGLDLLVRN